MTYFIADTHDDGLIKEEALAPELKELTEAATRRENLKEIAVIFFHTSCYSPDKMIECVTCWENFRAQ